MEGVCQPYKTMLSEKGWIYLINDSNDFYRWCYSEKKWGSDENEKVDSILNQRGSEIQGLGAKYLKFIIPEKNIVYGEYLPHIFHDKKVSSSRPACLMSKNNNNVHYLEKYLKSIKGFGRLYFRGDTHVNWFGAYNIYRYIVEKVNEAGVSIGNATKLSDQAVNVAKYKGDMYTQCSNVQMEDIHSVWGGQNLDDALCHEFIYTPNDKSFEYCEIPKSTIKYEADGRKVVYTKNKDKSLPKAVVFRDSTCDFIVDNLSNHFSEVIYIWHKGNVYHDVISEFSPDIVLHLMAERFVSNYYQRTPLN